MIIIEGQNNYVLYTNETGQVYAGQFLEEGTSIISNIEDVSTDKIEVYTP
jgi:hypothetical protein